MASAAKDVLAEGISVLGVERVNEQALNEYVTLLKKWNKPFNLTAVRSDSYGENICWIVSRSRPTCRQ